jgi:hypothetical protein
LNRKKERGNREFEQEEGEDIKKLNRKKELGTGNVNRKKERGNREGE